MNKVSLILTLPLSAVYALLALASSVGAQITYNAAADFGFNNPNGAWSYGFATNNALGTSFTLFDTYTTTSSGIFWKTSFDPTVPTVWKNTNTFTIDGVPANGISLHPGQTLSDDLYAVLRFTSPAEGIYSTSIDFFSGDVGDTDAVIIRNNDVLNPLFTASATDSDPSYTASLSLFAGDTIDIMVGPKGFVWSDNTPVNATFIVPEPSTYALLLLSGAASLWAFKRRKS